MTLHNSVLVVEGNAQVCKLLQAALRSEGCQVLAFSEGRTALEEAYRRPPSLVLLDLGLPLLHGMEVRRLLKQDERTKNVPVILLTGKEDRSDKLLGLGLGTDDYITKPFDLDELLARIRTILRRTEAVQTKIPLPEISMGPISMNLNRFEVTIETKPVTFTRAEFRILWALVENPGRVFSRGQLLNIICDNQVNSTDRTIDVHINAIRRKLGNFCDLVETVRGVGYRTRELKAQAG